MCLPLADLFDSAVKEGIGTQRVEHARPFGVFEPLFDLIRKALLLVLVQVFQIAQQRLQSLVEYGSPPPTA